MLKKYVGYAVLIICLAITLCIVASAKESTLVLSGQIESISNEKLLYGYATAINNRDIDSYILLFTNENRMMMSDYIDSYGRDEFFRERSVEIKDISELSGEIGIRSASLSVEESQKSNDIVVYYAELCIDGLQTENKVFVLIKEDGSWKIQRISTPDFVTIIDAGEGFNTITERQQMQRQESRKEEHLSVISEEKISQIGVASPNATPTADPTEVTVYFTKQKNKDYHKKARESLEFETYLKNVLPIEWTISWHEYYPAYLQAGTMASKMYAWWYNIHPKWNFSPYYSDVLDSSKDQNYLYSAYDDLGLKKYQGFVDEVLDYVRNIAMCDNEGEMFEVHYNATQGTQYSGQMSASGALSLAKEGYSMAQILHYYYDYSTYIGSDHRIGFFGYIG